MPSGRIFFEPPKSKQAIDFLMSVARTRVGQLAIGDVRKKVEKGDGPVLPKILGAILRENFS